jgi:aquaporin Z
MICAFGHVSAAHFNPAVTLGFAAARRFPAGQVPAYVAAQTLGALAAAWFLKSVFPEAPSYGATLTRLTPTRTFFIEFWLTFVLMTVIAAMATDDRSPRGLAGPAVGATVALCALFGGPLTGASMNPARSLAPALLEGRWENLWIYVLSSTAGAIVAALSYDAIRCESKKDGHAKQAKGCC